MKEHVRITLRIPHDLHQQATEMSKRLDRSLNGQFVALIRAGVAAEDQKGNAPAAVTGGASVEISHDNERNL